MGLRHSSRASAAGPGGRAGGTPRPRGGFHHAPRPPAHALRVFARAHVSRSGPAGAPLRTPPIVSAARRATPFPTVTIAASEAGGGDVGGAVRRRYGVTPRPARAFTGLAVRPAWSEAGGRDG